MRPKAEEDMKKRLFDFLIILLLAVLAFIAYSNTFDASFQMDDDVNIVSNENVHMEELSWEGLLRAAFPGPDDMVPQRPVALATFALNYYFGGLDVFGYHLVNIIIHIITGIGVYLLAKVTLETDSCRGALPSAPVRTGSMSGHGKASAIIAALAAVLWLVTPVQTQAVTYIVQRMTSMASLFYIWAFLFYVMGRLADTTRGRITYFSLTLLFFLSAIGTKPTSVTFPLMLIVYEFCFFQKKGGEKAFFWGVLVCLAVTAGLLYLLRGNIALDLFMKADYAMKERIYTEARIVIFYTILLFFPIPSKMAVYHDFQFSRGLLYPVSTLPALLLVVGAIAISVYRIRRDPVVSFFSLWYFINILAESLYPAIYPAFEHRLYLPSAGFFIVIAILLSRFWGTLGSRRKPVLLFAMIFIHLLFSVNTYGRNKDWHDPISLWEDNVRKSPMIPKPHEILGMTYLMKGGLDKAEKELNEAMRLDPLSPAGLGIGMVHYARGDYERAFKEFGYAARSMTLGVGVRQINASVLFYKMGQDLVSAGRVEDARRIFKLGLDFNPDDTNIKEALVSLDGR